MLSVLQSIFFVVVGGQLSEPALLYHCQVLHVSPIGVQHFLVHHPEKKMFTRLVQQV